MSQRRRQRCSRSGCCGASYQRCRLRRIRSRTGSSASPRADSPRPASTSWDIVPFPSWGAGVVVAALALGLAVGRRSPVVLGALAVALSFLATRLDPVPQDVRDSLAASLVAGAAAWMVAAMLTPPAEPSRSPFDARRRQLITTGVLGIGLIAVFGVAELRRMARQVMAASPIRADRPAIVPSDAAFVEVAGLSPKVTSRDDHYQIDINIADPVVDRD